MTTNGYKTGVAGAGTMGSGIAITIARSGIPVTLFDPAEESLGRSRQLVADFFKTAVAKGKLTQEASQAAVDRVSYTSKIEGLKHANVVVEAIFEDLAIKHELIGKLLAACGEDLLVLTNTSTLSITEIASGCDQSNRIVGAHYCLPAPLMKLVEMSRGLQTSDAAWNEAWDFQRATGQHPIETKDRPGFILNHFCIPYHNDVIRMIESGIAQPTEIDRAMKTAMGFAMGPCELIDLIGLDTQLRASEAFFAVTNNPRIAPPPLLRRMVAAGQLGRKTNAGFYNYSKDAIFGG